ncbi:MAG: exodeoxyribonuclease III [Candidatus Marinimicrobia bacterium]|nr:exodeoxyribonuclease III [Candidatus Neomarinimicrobiota bacterium]
MKLLSWNVNGFRAVLRKGFTEIVEEYQPDILGIQETKVKPEQLERVQHHIPEYDDYFFSADRPGYSGVAVYTKPRPLKVVRGFPSGWKDDEGRVLMLEYETFIFFNIYFPNGQKDDNRLQYKLDFYDFSLEYFDRLRKESGKGLVICGDYNTAHHPVDLARPKENERTSGFLPVERTWMDKFEAHGYIDTFRHFHPDAKDRYSWWSYRTRARDKNVGWRIDYFYVSPELLPYLRDADILDTVMGSDHCPVSLELEIPE